MLPPIDSSHRRLNLLTGEWVLVSPHRTARPWQGQVDDVAEAHEPEYDPSCYLCPGNARADGQRNPSYSAVFVFDNDYPALRTDPVNQETVHNGLLVSQAERGICRVGCFSPRHDLTLGKMKHSEIVAVIAMWRHEFADLA